tara:strand:+ start:1111 stop:2367 length:1257 start_codon:yes stop_codon:yes gene_type:complete
MSLLEESMVSTVSFDVERVRRDFPVLQEQIRGKELVYLDNAATTQKPLKVADALQRYYTNENANIHRGVHLLSQQATSSYERARGTVGHFLNATEPEEIVFLRGATEAVNLVAHGYGRQHVGSGDEIIVSQMEHHSNIVPWQVLCEERGATLRVAPINDAGEILLEEYEELLSERTKIVAITHASNALGTVNPVRKMVNMAHKFGAVVLIDGAQGVPHMSVDVREIGCDFYVFSGHKLFAPTGIGVLYGKKPLLNAMPPWETGGGMIQRVSFEHGTTYADVPMRFEAGTPHIAGAIGLAAAIDYINSIGPKVIADYEDKLLRYVTEQLEEVDGIKLIGTAKEKVGVVSFIMDDAHPHDIGTILDTEGIAVRAGHHCAQPLMQFYNVPATVRASLAFYNTRAEMDALVTGIRKVQEVFK